MTLDSPITELRGVGPALAAKFAVLGIRDIRRLIDYYPRRYDDYSQVVPIRALTQPGPVTVQATITSIKGRYVRRGMYITEAVASDETGSVRLIWFNQPYREQSMKHGEPYYISGQFELSHQRFSIQSPATELVRDFPINTARIVPIYRETKGITSRQIRAAVEQTIPLLDALPETLPAWVANECGLIPYAVAVKALHFPESDVELTAARHRLGFEEVYQLVLASLLNKQELQHEHAPAVAFDETLAKRFVSELPFKLTDDQRKVAWQIYGDMQRSQPMNRLVEGDVGSGKTVVAAMAALMVLRAGHQVALMAPTELLARQHADSLQRLLEPIGFGDRVGLLVGGLPAKQKAAAHERVASGDLQFLVGTNAVIQERVDMQALELIIIDEQHRFGVDQRKALMTKAGHMPHVLSLTATPIPRSLALTLYGELDISVLAEKPPGRQPVLTEIVAPSSRPAVYKKAIAELRAGRQLFVVCPLITEAETAENTKSSKSAAEAVFARLKEHELKDWRVGLLHGRMKAEEKNAIMEQFVRHELDALVSTTVIEVGVDVPNASVMILEDAERFGLAQIHQLRGRVGRGEHQAYCFLMLGDSNPPSRRLRALEQTNDGFRLAEFDLEQRGPGAIYGREQHGQLDLRIAKLDDVRLIAKARTAAQQTIDRGENLLQYKELAAAVKRLRAVTNLN